MELQDDYAAFQELDAEILAVSVDDLSGAARAIDALGLEYQILADPGADTVRAYGVFNLHNNNLPTPSTFIVDKEGAIRWQYIGRNARTDRPDNDDILAQLRALPPS